MALYGAGDTLTIETLRTMMSHQAEQHE